MPASSRKERYILQLDQQFQKVKGIFIVGTTKMIIKDGELRGDTLRFTIVKEVEGRTEDMLFEGRVNGNSIKGSVIFKLGPMAKRKRWKAKRNAYTITLLDNKPCQMILD